MLEGIGFNSFSLDYGRIYTKHNRTLGQAVERLATGLSINRAKDDVANTSIIESLKSSIKGYEVAEKNIGDGMSLVQTAQSGLSGISDALQDIRGLAVQANNSALGSTEKQAIQNQINSRLADIDSMANDTSFNGKKLLDGSSGSLSIQTGAENSDTTAVDLSGNFKISSSSTINSGNINEGNIGGSSGVALNNINVTTGNLDDILTGIDNALENVSAAQSNFGASENAFSSKLEGLSEQKLAALETQSSKLDSNYAQEASNFVQSYILRNGSATISQQANANNRLALNLLPIVKN